MSPESVPLAMPPNNECGEQEEVWSGDIEHEEEVWSGPSSKNCDEIKTTKAGNEEIENCEDKVEEPKEGMAFDTSEEAYSYYLRYAREKRFAIAKRSSRKGSDGKLRHIGFECCRAGKARVRTSNPIKPRPQTKIDCPAHVTVGIHPDGKWRLNTVVLKHNHEQSPGKARYFKCNRVLDEHVKRKLELNDKAGIQVYKTYDSLQIEAGGPDKLPYLKKDLRNHLDKQRRLRLVEGDAEAMHRYFMRMKTDNSDFFFAMDLDDNRSLLLGRVTQTTWGIQCGQT